jgi:hypothetical protein
MLLKMKRIRAKSTVLALLSLLILSCQSENEFVLKGNIIAPPNGAKVYLVNDESGLVEDSLAIENGQFNFRGKVPYPKTYTLKFISDSGSQGFDLWVDNVEINLDGDWGNLGQMTVLGSTQQDLKKMEDDAIAFFNPEMARLQKENKQDSIPQLLDRLTEVITEFAVKHSNTYYGVSRLYALRERMDRNLLSQTVKNIQPEILESAYGKSLLLHLQFPELTEGDAYIDFSVPSLQGNNYSISQYLQEKKPVLLILGGLGCMGNRGRELLKSFQQDYGDEVGILAFVFARNKREMEGDIKCSKNVNNCSFLDLNVPLISDLRGDHSPIKIRYGVQTTPTVYVIDPNGTIRLKTIGYYPGVNDVLLSLIKKLTDDKV